MMRTIWKYPLEFGTSKILLPEDSIPLHVGVQGERVHLWVEQFVLTSEHPCQEHIYEVIGTGHALPDFPCVSYIGTVDMSPFIWHIYECFE